VKEMILRKLAVKANVLVGAGLHVGPGSRIWAPTKLQIGRDVYVGKFVTIELDGRIGDGCLIANNVGIVGRSDHDMRRVGTIVRNSQWVGNDPQRLSEPVNIGSDVWIGYGAIILSGSRIGDSAVVAAGAVVTGDVPSNAVVAGAPAHVVGWRFSDGELAQHWDRLRAQGYALSGGTE
jgi:acetyltransferase-like isoleucine patch superfamily enzyme